MDGDKGRQYPYPAGVAELVTLSRKATGVIRRRGSVRSPGDAPGADLGVSSNYIMRHP